MDERIFTGKIKEYGGRVFIVGGWVRDKLRGAEPHDKDYVVTGIETDLFEKLFGDAKRVGKSFPVYRLELDGRNAEIAMARRERKTAPGYKGFAVFSDSSITIEEDLLRRDTTMNAMAIELPGGELIDPYNGRGDIAGGKIRAVSKHFLEDPVRALRAARQAAVFGFEVTDDTIELMRSLSQEIAAEPGERIQGEMEKALNAKKPSVFFRVLERAGLLSCIFPEIFALRGKTQPKEFHPEGDAFEHSMQVLDKVAEKTPDVVARFAALVHDLGKGTTPKEMEPHHYGHENRGLKELAKWDARVKIPNKWLQTAEFVIREHMRAPRLKKDGKIVDLIMGINKLPSPADGVLSVFFADHHGLPWYLSSYEAILEKLLAVSGKNAPPGISGPAVGAWVHGERTKELKKIKGQIS